LVDELEQIKKNSGTEYDDEAAYLTSVSNRIEAEMIEALLNSHGIPVLKKSREAGGYLDIYMGATIFGVDLYVPSKLLKKAKEIIASNPENVEEDVQDYSEEEDSSELDEKYKEKRRTNTWILLLFYIGLLWIIVTVLYNLFQWIIRKI
jgi:predicted nucleic acid-binding Zn ribbon protein